MFAFTRKIFCPEKHPTHISHLLVLPPLLSCCLFSAEAKLILKWKIIKDIKEVNLNLFFPFRNIFKHTIMTLEIIMHKQEQHDYKHCKLAKTYGKQTGVGESAFASSFLHSVFGFSAYTLKPVSCSQ